jgi:O-antigen/teichoic acid export membrane protein
MSIASSISARSAGRDLGYLTVGRARASVAGVFWSFANAGVSVALTMTVFLVTSRILTPAEFGAVALAVAIVSIAGAIVPVAFGEALVQRADLENRHTDSVFWMTATLAVMMAGLLTALAPMIAEMTGVALLALILPVLSLRIILDAGLTVPAALITRRMQFRYIAVRTTLANGMGAALCLWMVTHGYALWALVMSQVFTSFASLAVTLLAARWRPGFAVERGAVRDLGRFGIYSMGGRVLNEARLEQLFLGLVLGPAVLGFYFFARRLFDMLRDLTAGVFSPVTNVLLASLQHDTARRREFYLAACFASASLAFPVFSGFMAIAPTAIPYVFGPQWTDAVLAVRCFAVIGLMAGLGVMQASLIRYLGQPGWWFWYQTTMQLSTIPLILLLYPFGLDAIMIAVVLRTLLLWPVSVMKAQSLLDVPLATYLRSVLAPAVAALAMASLVAALPIWAPSLDGLTLLAAQVGGGAALYGLLLLALARRRIAELWHLYSRDHKATA